VFQCHSSFGYRPRPIWWACTQRWKPDAATPPLFCLRLVLIFAAARSGLVSSCLRRQRPSSAFYARSALECRSADLFLPPGLASYSGSSTWPRLLGSCRSFCCRCFAPVLSSASPARQGLSSPRKASCWPSCVWFSR
jgi:hypothetical protein